MNCEARSLNEYRIIEEKFESQTIRNNNSAPSNSDPNNPNNMEKEMPIMKFDAIMHISFYTTQLDKMVDFYTNVLGA